VFTLPHISLHSKKGEVNGAARACSVLWPILEVDFEELVKGGVAVLQALPLYRIHSSQILRHEVLKQLNVLHLLCGLISRKMISSQRISQHMSRVKIISKLLSAISLFISALQFF